MAVLSPQEAQVVSQGVHVGFVVDKLALGQVFV